jgi:hypothetical protein
VNIQITVQECGSDIGEKTQQRQGGGNSSKGEEKRILIPESYQK